MAGYDAINIQIRGQIIEKALTLSHNIAGIEKRLVEPLLTPRVGGHGALVGQSCNAAGKP
jgi:hypothetical protein